MATGWAGDGAVQDQIDATIKDSIQRARSKLPQGPGLRHCEHCEAAIPAARRQAVPGVRLCVTCQQAQDLGDRAGGGYNRRGSKDSQLR
ncbi:MAG: hypothetical protein COS34_03335 [Lysobacterales bacterium CG02_land_8_20_14_3_00_62_12]|nr:MAG: hypothetical protein COS34_03335 [Xanthomonadales bacterium CG02_land_8_20_14_3_00_62_12]